MPPFEWLAPRSVDAAVRALAEDPEHTVVLAGGTDLVPNLKRGLLAPRRVIGLGRVDELTAVGDTPEGGLWLGAGVTLDRLAAEPRVRARYPALAAAAEAVAGPQLRRMGTLGGNLCLDTRCVYYDQSAFWRDALGHCLKTEGDRCHVVPTGKRCVAALSADTPAPLIAYRAEVELRSVRGPRTMPVAELYSGDGACNLARARDELVVGVRLPPPEPSMSSAYHKVRARAAIDFPLLSVAAAVTERDVRVVVAALGPRPRQVRVANDVASTRPLTDDVVAAIAAAAAAQCHPLANLGVPAWRAAMVAPAVRRVLGELVPSERDLVGGVTRGR